MNRICNSDKSEMQQKIDELTSMIDTAKQVQNIIILKGNVNELVMPIYDDRIKTVEQFIQKCEELRDKCNKFSNQESLDYSMYADIIQEYSKLENFYKDNRIQEENRAREYVKI